MLKIYFSASYDEIEARLKGMKEFYCKIFNVDRIPTHSVIHRGMKKTSTKFLRELLGKQFYKLRKIGDGDLQFRFLGEKFGRVARRKGKEGKRKKDYLKLHVLVDVDSGQLLDVRMTKSEKHDSPVGKAMLRRVWFIASVSGDKACFSREACTIVNGKNVQPYFKPKGNATAKSKGHSAYREMMKEREDDEKAWESAYYLRSFVESAFSSIKKRFGRALSSMKKRFGKRELLLKGICYNIKEALYNLEAFELGISRWVKR